MDLLQSDDDVEYIDREINSSKKLPVLVRCSKQKYMDYRAELMKKGWKEWQHFKWYKFVQRKVCLISANCHGPVLEHYLL